MSREPSILTSRESVGDLVREVVAEVMRRLPASASASGPAVAGTTAGPVAHASRPDIRDRVVTLASIERLPEGVTSVVIDAGAVVTPSAAEAARDRRIRIVREAGRPLGTAARPFRVVALQSEKRAMTSAAALAHGRPGCDVIVATSLAAGIEQLGAFAARNDGRGMLLTGRAAVAAILANREPSLRAIVARDVPSALSAMGEVSANLVICSEEMPIAACSRLVDTLAAHAAVVPDDLVRAKVGCGCSGNPH